VHEINIKRLISKGSFWLGMLVLGGSAFSVGNWFTWNLPAWTRQGVQAKPHGRLGQLEDGVIIRAAGVPTDAGHKRKLLHSQLKAIQAMRPKAIVVEAFLEEESQTEAKAFFGQLTASAHSLPVKEKKQREAFMGLIEGMRDQLQLDRDLALTIAEDSNIILSCAAEGAVNEKVQESVALERYGFNVNLRGNHQARLGRFWALRRFPLPLFMQTTLAGVVEQGGFSQGLPVVFDMQKRWMPGLGLLASLYFADLGLADLQFVWLEKRLAGVRVGGLSCGLDDAGLAWPMTHTAMASLDYESVVQGLMGPGRIAGKAVFFRPWPLNSEEGAAFDRQQQVFAGMRAGNLAAKPPQDLSIWIRLILGLLVVALAFGSPVSISGAVVLAFWLAFGFWGQGWLVFGLAGLWGMGLGGKLLWRNAGAL
jgi:hypothetical protein